MKEKRAVNQWHNEGGAIVAAAPEGTFWGAAFSAISVLKTLTRNWLK